MTPAQVAAALLLASVSRASLPLFSSPQRVLCGAEPLDVGSHSSPWVGDWDGDGLADLIVGQFDDGMVRICINRGTAHQPVYTACGWLSADGQPIKLPYG